ncbi:MAG: hypothetical protein KY468_17210 [Armatimonadetes bacterium]|nr:hypothetical protein [Armatimonadota bacterium]
MDNSRIIEELRGASPFDLYRLRVAIDQLLDHPDRIEQVRSRLTPGMRIRYFEEGTNREVEATVLELHRTRLLVQNQADGERWSIRFCTVNVDHADTVLHPPPERGGLDRSRLKVGDAVGFRDRQNRDRYGHIMKLNQKTATVMTMDHQQWRVAYPLLFPVLDMSEGER